MKIKVIPPLVMVIFGFLMYLLDRFLPVGEFDFFGRPQMAVALFVFAIIVFLLALYQLKRVKTTLDPIHPEKASVLVNKGVFKYSRNPIYLAMLILLLAFGIKLGNAFNTLLAAGFVYFMNHFQIKYEEEALLKKFGKEYQLYLKAVRRWF
ncbi:methyltransferase family protein [Allomuricauda sp. SCSIO 65647]|uniref:methyltransferase family protein n=1 Tax=Allomuricauda sp. SCSIO 65647 TaxID=2908843 RepID=UPI001F22B73A|nr:isoprenylcysteine carboxylmethyltransferase family protein [Muricauda sp. SCSIO 65647]UJH67654.1 isoprenylcysteine carboxylmethyltransferase family protein [Muricauda sp. SCSIO 65647]